MWSLKKRSPIENANDSLRGLDYILIRSGFCISVHSFLLVVSLEQSVNIQASEILEKNITLLVGTPFYSCLITSSLLTCLSAGQFLSIRTVPDHPEWSGSGNKFTQRHLCHFRGTILYCFFCSTKSGPNLLTLTLCTLGRNLETNFTEARTCNLCLVKL